MDLNDSQTLQNLKDAFAGESQSQPALPLLRRQGGRRGRERRRCGVSFHGGGRNRPRPRPPRVHGGGRRPGHRAAHRDHQRQPQGGHRRRDSRVHRHVPRHGESRAGRGLRGNLRLVRDLGEGRGAPTPIAFKRPWTPWSRRIAEGDACKLLRNLAPAACW